MNIEDFKKELADLLEKYDLSIGLQSDPCSDWHGITGEHMAAYDHKNNKTYALNDGNWIEANELAEK